LAGYKAACDANSACAGFNSQGWIKTSLSNAGSSQGYNLYTKNNFCIPEAGYTCQLNTDSVGNDIEDVTTGGFAGYKAACDANSGCVAFNSQGWIKTSVSNSGPSQGYNLYIKISVTADEDNNDGTPTIADDNNSDTQTYIYVGVGLGVGLLLLLTIVSCRIYRGKQVHLSDIRQMNNNNKHPQAITLDSKTDKSKTNGDIDMNAIQDNQFITNPLCNIPSEGEAIQVV